MLSTALSRLVLLLGLLACFTFAYEVSIEDIDYSRQICSGMWGGTSTYINVTFEPQSQGQVAMVVYEWADSSYLGKVIDPNADYFKTYVCTSSVVAAGHCTQAQLGQFLIDLPEGKSMNNTSFWSARVVLPDKSDNSSTTTLVPKDNSTGNLSRRQSLNSSPQSPYRYVEPIHYIVRKTGYYCVAIVPVTVQSAARDVLHPTYKGTALFRNTFDGKLPATDYPKVNFYFMMLLVYVALAGLWGWLCYKHVHELLPIQYYLSGLIGLLVIEMVANWGYYRYLNAHGKSTASTVFLIVVAVLDAGRNSMSFFMLLVVSLGLSVVSESLGRTMFRCQLLAGAHFVFGILYAIGIVELEIQSTSGLVLLLFIVPLAFTLSGFLLWIMYALNATIAQLQSRKQHYKLSMFKKLHRILMLVVVVIIAFFVVSSFVFSGRLAEDYAARSWKVQWWLLDGWMALLYLAAFSAIVYLWRPSTGNGRLVLSDELAQDEAEAEDYDLESLDPRGRRHAEDDDDDATLVGRRGDGHETVSNDIVFEIGDEDGGSEDEDENKTKKRRTERSRNENGELEERQGLVESRND